MFKFIKKKFTKNNHNPISDTTENPPSKISDTATPDINIFSRFKDGLTRTKNKFFNKLTVLLGNKKQLDSTTYKELENILIAADVGVATTQHILSSLPNYLKDCSNEENSGITALGTCLFDIISPMAIPLEITSQDKPFVLMVAGINGAGKTTTIGKIAKHLQQQGKKVLLAAGDTFRAAAISQLQVWGQRNNIPVISQHQGADSASVIFDALQAATARNFDIVIADTAGRLHTQIHLMQELQKITRVLKKIDSNAPHEIMLVLDASTGQNAIQQVAEFKKAININSISITKLDGTAKGGAIIAIAEQCQLPIRFIGIGEGIDDLKEFSVIPFIEALLSNNDTSNVK